MSQSFCEASTTKIVTKPSREFKSFNEPATSSSSFMKGLFSVTSNFKLLMKLLQISNFRTIAFIFYVVGQVLLPQEYLLFVGTTSSSLKMDTKSRSSLPPFKKPRSRSLTEEDQSDDTTFFRNSLVTSQLVPAAKSSAIMEDQSLQNSSLQLHRSKYSVENILGVIRTPMSRL